MKTTEEIEARIRALLAQELTLRVAEAAERMPHRCVNNHRQPLDTRRLVDGETNDSYNRVTLRRSLPVLQTMGLCMLGSDDPEQWQGNICEDQIDAQRCPVYDPIVKKADILARFYAETQNFAWLEVNLPEIFQLYWVLDTVAAQPLPWWKRLQFFLLRINVEPIQPGPDFEKLLPPPASV